MGKEERQEGRCHSGTVLPGSGIKFSETFLYAFMPGNVRIDCVYGIKRSTLFSVFPLTKRNDSLIYKCFFCP